LERRRSCAAPSNRLACGPGRRDGRPPVTMADLRDEGLSEPFAAYMRTWKGFVEEA
jgi:hypothetical protein